MAAVAALAFYLTLNWPLDIAVWTSRLAALSPAAVADAPPARADFSCAVASITDGDTLRCRDGSRIRLHAVAARETDGTCSPGHPCPSASAEAATNELRRLAQGQTLRCQSTGRSYDRVTAICWTPAGVEINCAMIRSGTALIWDRFDQQSPLCRRQA